ncbi:uncharacterized protein H6S33_006955 [Morchella sextelata]|uniref:uncharacterized protein n=1 Tax=Morchella sextelata TaxID=1174677 RepID=UPI001D03AD5C|nr:uncharacterized protein H6S33_006955 [Morchella sextelata]KAH0604578.1 hypothetical protein H6S33_006955 [Morchella sextelata]
MSGENRASGVCQVQRPDPRRRWSSRSTPGAAGVIQEQSGVLQEQSEYSRSCGSAPGAVRSAPRAVRSAPGAVRSAPGAVRRYERPTGALRRGD